MFSDPLAVRILGEDADTIAADAEKYVPGRRMRIFIAVRTRFAEDALRVAVEAGVRQLVVLGAGLDTYAYRGTERDRLRIFEVDHPDTQAWKRERLTEAGIPLPGNLTFAPVDFERHTLAEGLAAGGFDPAQPAFFTWLGVVPYLSREAIDATLGYIANLTAGAHVVFDYGNPPDSVSAEARAVHDVLAARVAELGESFQTFFETDDLRQRLLKLGFTNIDDLGPREFATRYFPQRALTMPEKGGHIVHAMASRRKRWTRQRCPGYSP